MKLGKSGKLVLAIAISGFINGMVVIGAKAEEEYSFKTHNSTENTITEILVSEDNSTWGKFDIGSGIKPGETVSLVWDKSTNDQNCNQHVKAVFDDGSESESAEFDFCEKDLDLEF